MPEQIVGKITHYFSKIGVAVVEISEGELRQGLQIIDETLEIADRAAAL